MVEVTVKVKSRAEGVRGLDWYGRWKRTIRGGCRGKTVGGGKTSARRRGERVGIGVNISMGHAP